MKFRSIFLSLTIVFATHGSISAQQEISQLPLIAQPSQMDPAKPLVFYITGDGGWNKFSKALTQELLDEGFPVVSLDASKYFWSKKTASESATVVASAINHFSELWKRNQVIFLGYSFGADVMPFIYNEAQKNLKTKVRGICLLSPSTRTDFEVHVMEMLGAKSSRGESVVKAINNVNAQMILLVFGDDEKDFPVQELTVKNCKTVVLPGGHHYDHATKEVSKIIIQNMDKPGT